MSQSKSSPKVDIEAQHVNFVTAHFHRLGWRRVELVRDVLQQVIEFKSVYIHAQTLKHLGTAL